MFSWGWNIVCSENWGMNFYFFIIKSLCSILTLYLYFPIIIWKAQSSIWISSCYQVPWQPAAIPSVIWRSHQRRQPLLCSGAMLESWAGTWWTCDVDVVIPAGRCRCQMSSWVIRYVSCVKEGFPPTIAHALISHVNPQLIEKLWASLLQMLGPIAGEEVCFEMLGKIVGETGSFLWPHCFGRNRRGVLLQIILQTEKER